MLIEVQNGEYLGGDDIVRFQDDYARTLTFHGIWKTPLQTSPLQGERL